MILSSEFVRLEFLKLHSSDVERFRISRGIVAPAQLPIIPGDIVVERIERVHLFASKICTKFAELKLSETSKKRSFRHLSEVPRKHRAKRLKTRFVQF